MQHRFETKKPKASGYKRRTNRSCRRSRLKVGYTLSPLSKLPLLPVDCLKLDDFKTREDNKKQSRLILAKNVDFCGWKEICTTTQDSRIKSQDGTPSFKIDKRSDEAIRRAIKSSAALRRNPAKFLVLIEYMGEEEFITCFSKGNTKGFVRSPEEKNMIWVAIPRKDKRDMNEFYVEERTFRRTAVNDSNPIRTFDLSCWLPCSATDNAPTPSLPSNGFPDVGVCRSPYSSSSDNAPTLSLPELPSNGFPDVGVCRSPYSSSSDNAPTLSLPELPSNGFPDVGVCRSPYSSSSDNAPTLSLPELPSNEPTSCPSPLPNLLGSYPSEPPPLEYVRNRLHDQKDQFPSLDNFWTPHKFL